MIRRSKASIVLMALVLGAPIAASSVVGAQTVSIEDYTDGLGLGEGYTAVDVVAPLFDNFDSSPTDLGNPINAWGGIRLDLDALLDDPTLAQEAIGLRDSEGGLFDSIEILADDGSGLSAETSSSVIMFDLQQYLDADRSATDPLTESRVAQMFDRVADAPELGEFLAELIDTSIPEIFADGFESGDVSAWSDGYQAAVDQLQPAASGFVADRITPAGAPPDFPNPVNLHGGPDVLIAQQRDAFAGGGGRRENILRLDIPALITVPTGGTIGGMPPYIGSFLSDIFNGANTILGVRDEGSGPVPFAMSYLAQGWTEIPPFGDVAVDGNHTIFVLPPEVLDAASGFGFAAFVQAGPTAAPGQVGSSAFPALPSLIAVSELGVYEPAAHTPLSLDEVVAMMDVDIAAAVAAEAPLETPDPDVVDDDGSTDAAASDSPDETAGEAEPADVAVDETSQATTSEGDTSGSFRTWVLITVLVVVGMALVIGYWRYQRTRERGGAGTSPGVTTPPPTPPSAPGGSTPRSTVIEEHTECDWELHYWTGTKWHVVRAAPWNRHKCCVYKVKVGTKVTRHEQVASFRQDVTPERLYMPDLDFGWNAMDFEAHASTRSGPEGLRGWMHGDGDPLDQAADAPDAPYWQRSQGEERPEVAAHVGHDEITRISIELEAGCTDSESHYHSKGNATVRYMGTFECTNDDPAPSCPVELNAFGDLYSEAFGDLSWWTGSWQGTDPDELERILAARNDLSTDDRESTPPHSGPSPGSWDSHDHDDRDRMTFQGTDMGSDTSDITDLKWRTAVWSGVETDAGQLVPQHVWPTTERVSTHIEHEIDQEMEVSGHMIRGDCEATGCCTGNAGHKCHCAPEFRLVIDAGNSRIEVDDMSFPLDRDPSRADRHSPPSATSTNPYVAWQLL